MKTKTLPNIHPGEVLFEEFLLPMEISQNALARATGVLPRRINEKVRCQAEMKCCRLLTKCYARRRR